MTEFTAIKIGNRIKKEMRKQKITVAKMAKDIYMSPNGIYRIWTGKVYPSLFSAVIIADYLGISLDYLILGKQ